MGRLDLETPRLSPSSSPFEFPPFAGNIRLATVKRSTKVFDGLSRVPLAAEKDRVGPGRSTKGELVKSETLSTSSDDSLTSRSGEFESGNREFGNLGKTLVVENGTDGDNGPGVVWV